jgi:hypothetical protein
MRMWNVKTEILCRQHLLGEHQEVHSFIGTIKKGTSLKGYINKGLVEVHNIKKRHDELAEEMKKRGYNHKTPMEEFEYKEIGYVNSNENLKELYRRCENCRNRIINNLNGTNI